MNTVATLRVAGDLLYQAERIRDVMPDVAAMLELDSRCLIDTVPCISVAEAAELLGQSRPTIYEWIKAGYLLSTEQAARGRSISPKSVVTLLPILEQWEDDGRPGRPSRLLQQWFAGAVELQDRRRKFADRRRAGISGLHPPRVVGTVPEPTAV